MNSSEIEIVAHFINTYFLPDSIPEMEEDLLRASGFMYRIGTLVNEAEREYSLKKSNKLAELLSHENETETTRKAKLDAFVAEEKYLWNTAKNLKSALRSIQMSLFQAIKTRRDER